MVALCIGLVINLVHGSREVADLAGDEPDYYRLAARLAESQHYGLPGKLAFRAPGYPAVLATVFVATGPGVVPARVLQSVLAAAMVVLSFLIARALAGPIAGWLAAGFLMVDSYWWLNQWSLLQENTAGLLFGALYLYTLRRGLGPSGPAAPHDRPASPARAEVLSSREAAVAGVLCGLGLLVKPTLLPLLVVVPAAALLVSRRGPVCRAAFVFSMAAAITVAPWTLRNAAVFDAFVPLTTGAGRVFHGAHCEATAVSPGGWFPIADVALADSAGWSPPAREVVRDHLRWQAGWTYLRSQSAGEVGSLVVAKWARLASPSTFFSADSAGARVAKGALLLVNALVLLGAFLWVIRRRRGWAPAALLFASTLVTVTIFWGSIRFRYPLQPVIAALSAAWWVHVRRLGR